MEIVHADELEFFRAGGKKLRRLSGNVQLRHNDAVLWCHQADYYQDDNRVIATGNVRIVQSDTIRASAEQLHYDGLSRQARLAGKVHLTDGHLNLYSNELDYDLRERVARYVTGGRVRSDETELTSRQGRFSVPRHEALFIGQVVMTHPRFTLRTDSLLFHTQSRICFFIAPTEIRDDSGMVRCRGGYYDLRQETALFTQDAFLRRQHQWLKADSIFYHQRSQLAELYGHLIWTDSLARMTVRGQRGRFDERTRAAQVHGRALLATVLNNDSLFLGSDRLYVWRHPGQQQEVQAAGGVKVYSDDLQAICDSMTYSDDDSTFHLFGQPVLWAGGYQLNADTVRMTVANRTIHRLYLRQNAFAAQAAGATGYNQARGKNITGYFRDGQLDYMEIDGNGESIYHVFDEQDSYIGINRVACGSMVLYFDSAGRVSRIFFIQQPEAVLFPPAQLPEEQRQLRHFVWKEAWQPKSREELFR